MGRLTLSAVAEEVTRAIAELDGESADFVGRTRARLVRASELLAALNVPAASADASILEIDVTDEWAVTPDLWKEILDRMLAVFRGRPNNEAMRAEARATVVAELTALHLQGDPRVQHKPTESALKAERLRMIVGPELVAPEGNVVIGANEIVRVPPVTVVVE